MRASFLKLVLVSVALAVGACSVLLDFRPEGQPCDSTGACLAGFACVDGKCHASDAGVLVDPCNGCPVGQRCKLGSAPSCVPDTCANRICPVGFACAVVSNGTVCNPISAPSIGHPCSSDSQCQAEDPTHFCFTGAVQAASGGGTPRTGVCMERCSAGNSCSTIGAVCKPLSLGLDAGSVKLCLPQGLFTPCSDDSVCAPSGLVCTVFDSAAQGPVTLCDAPLAGGAAIGDGCQLTSPQNVASELCANGLCVPRSTGTCGQLCDTGTCGGGQTCALVEFSNPGPTRLLPICISASTSCLDCTSSAQVCGPDAPHCTSMGATSHCLPACQLDAGTQLQCPPGSTCSSLGPGPRCVPTGGCP